MSEFDSGIVGVNNMSLSFKNIPFGGMKESGLGRENGSAALKAYTDLKTVIINMTY